MINIQIKEHVGIIEKHSRTYREVTSLVKSCSNDLSMFIYSKDSELFDYLSERENVRAELLLGRVGAGDENKTHLILATSQQSKEFLGFAICSPCLVNSKSASITMIAVKESFRNKGVFKSIIEYIKSNYSHVSLTCKPELVPLYQKFKFNIKGVFQTNICMEHGNTNIPGKLISVDDEYVMRHPSVVKELRKLRGNLGSVRVDECVAKWQKDFSSGEDKARSFYEEYAKNAP